MKALFVSIALLSAMSGAYSHHEIHEDVNLGHLIQFGGTIMGLEWAEPHVLIRIVGNPDLRNSPQWLVELDSSTDLEARGLNMTDFEVLSHVSIVGYPARSGSNTRENRIYGLYLARSPTHKELLNERLLDLLPLIEGIKAIPSDGGARFEATHNN